MQRIVKVTVEYLSCFYGTTYEDEMSRMFRAYFHGDASWWDRVKHALGNDLVQRLQYIDVDDEVGQEQILRMCLTLPLFQKIREDAMQQRA